VTAPRSRTSDDDKGWTVIVASTAINPFMPAPEFKRAIDTAIRGIRNSARLPNVERIWLPGEQSHAKLLDRRAHGIPMPKSLRDSLDAVARELRIAALE
jgi:L-2-hydroxycarboxylate dehydrogenase (NAD+)